MFGRINALIEKDLDTPAEAQLKVDAVLNGRVVSVAGVGEGVKTESKDLKLQIALVEKELRYSGENGIRFHPMVVRAMGGKEATVSASVPWRRRHSWNFDLDKVSAAIKAHLDDYEAKGHRGEPSNSPRRSTRSIRQPGASGFRPGR